MEDSDSDINSPTHPLHRVLFGSVEEKFLQWQILFGDEGLDNDTVRRNLEDEFNDHFNFHRNARCVPPFQYDGDMIGNMYGTSVNVAKHWTALEPHERRRRWHREFRMSEDIFEQLFALVEPFFTVSEHKRNADYREYSLRKKLLLALHYLAFAPTFAAMGTKFGVPANSLSVVCVRPALEAMYECMFVSALTKVIRFPKSKEAIDLALQTEGGSFVLLGCLGAIDGSLIPCKKPTRKSANEDTDAWYGYKGYICTLLLAVVDTRGRFLYVHAGAPGSCGDTGLFSQCGLKQVINTGILTQSHVSIAIGQVQHEVHPYIIGDSAFNLQTYMMIGHGRPPAAKPTDKGKFNRRIITSRRTVECTFGRLKGRWQFCHSNMHHGDPAFITVAVVVCCCLHNFLEDRNVEPDDDVLHNMANPLELFGPPAQHQVQDDAPAGRVVRDLLTKWAGQFPVQYLH